MKTAMVNILTLIISVILLQGCITNRQVPHKTFFNKKAFAGFVDMNVDRNDAMLNCELDGADGNAVVCNSCRDALKIPETAIAESHHHLWRLMQINCRAAVMINDAYESAQSNWPSSMNKQFIDELPADAVPHPKESSLDEPKGLLKDAEPTLKIIHINSRRAEVTIHDDMAVKYIIMARGDIDGDGMEDILLRLDWHIKEALGKGVSLLLMTKPEKAETAEILWRDG